MGGLISTLVHQSWYCRYNFTNSGSLGASASTSALVASDPVAMLLWIHESDQNVIAPDCSSAAAYVWSRVTVPRWLGLPSHTQRAFLVHSALKRYVHLIGRILASGGGDIGGTNIYCTMYWLSFLFDLDPFRPFGLFTKDIPCEPLQKVIMWYCWQLNLLCDRRKIMWVFPWFPIDPGRILLMFHNVQLVEIQLSYLFLGIKGDYFYRL